MGWTWLLLERKTSAGGSKEGALVLGRGGHFQSPVWPVGCAGSHLPCLAAAVCCWHKLQRPGSCLTVSRKGCMHSPQLLP